MNESMRNIYSRMKDAIGKKCWNVTVGGCTLPQFTMALGKKIRMQEPVNNPSLPKAARIFEGEVSFFIRCSWRLEHGGSIVVTSDDKEELITSALDCLVGRTLEQIKLERPAWDLCLEFSDRWRLKVFADCEIHGYSILRNWHFRIAKNSIYAGPGENIDVVQKAEGS